VQRNGAVLVIGASRVHTGPMQSPGGQRARSGNLCADASDTSHPRNDPKVPNYGVCACGCKRPVNNASRVVPDYPRSPLVFWCATDACVLRVMAERSNDFLFKG
jgi:hypothetical protein